MTEMFNKVIATSVTVSILGILPYAEASAAPTNFLEMQDSLLSQQNSLGQVNSVFQLRDIAPSDWAFDALRNLVEKYNCIAGYPDSTFRGDRPLSRYEFAAGLNACVQQIERLIVGGGSDVDTADITRLQALVQEFEAELGTLSARVDDVGGRVEFLEDNQFSITTKLKGEVVFALTDVLTGDSTTSTFPSIFSPTGNIDIENPSQQTVFANRVRLDFLTSFTGQDLLKARLTSGNFPHPNRPGGFQYAPNPLRGYQGGLAFSSEGQQTFNDIADLPGDNSVGITELSYEFPIGDKAEVTIMATGGEHHDYVPSTFSSWDDDNGGTGSLSVFGQRSAIYNFAGSGIGLNYDFNDSINISAGYLATYASNPSSPDIGNPFAGGLFDGRYSALAQLTIKPTDNFSFGLTYSHSFHPVETPFNSLPIFFNDQGTNLANFPVVPTQEVSVNSYGLQTLWELSPKFAVNAWFAYNQINTSSGTAPFGLGDYSSSTADVLTYGISLAFPDLLKEGNLGGVVVGASPYATEARVPEPFRTGGNWFGSDLGDDYTDLIAGNSIPWHIEAFYRHQMTDNISLTPGVIWLTAPNQSSQNPDVVVGTLRLTFSF
ncbi:cyanobacterial porin [[Leptolyngbya] sp. PCC 7376]|uniref:iron uptake porin n=1 Tax=[Leptolyngbya] sp. PCC 7376 TaxID=111781 RepID=UPI00029F428A|nr:iron uptake porin [[Leptolyngbya] sp. PCC 7376]AFY37605.1 cyanobacterial porin [[Leptolyngbya] sp. PCC 7376]